MAQDPQGCGAFPRLQHRAVALRESKLAGWALEAGRVRVRLDAYVHVSQGRPGVDAGTAWELGVELLLEEARIEAEPAEVPLWLTGGAIALGAAPQPLLPLPCAHRGPVRLELIGDGGRLAVSATGLTATETSAPRFVERFAGARALDRTAG